MIQTALGSPDYESSNCPANIIATEAIDDLQVRSRKLGEYATALTEGFEQASGLFLINTATGDATEIPHAAPSSVEEINALVGDIKSETTDLQNRTYSCPFLQGKACVLPVEEVCPQSELKTKAFRAIRHLEL